ncbi:EAL domain-containing protein [Jatrophihabitans telluris]|uniref:EAL domain-containing protein n=1 Tax=Jatrophihabitans telluris TaxID=2038343 RepID=A0ABY4QV85_9ACTN|nr:EAL domain-containing protein [Jatrophihabitans telluris]UQX87596.1 EAL domain-containing protein [Jatrophihabitans telluris]
MDTVAYLFPRGALMLVAGTTVLVHAYLSPEAGFARWAWLLSVSAVVLTSSAFWLLRARFGPVHSFDQWQAIVTMVSTASLYWGFYTGLKGYLTPTGKIAMPFAMMAFTAAGAHLVAVYFPAALAFILTSGVGLSSTVDVRDPFLATGQIVMIGIWLAAMLMASHHVSATFDARYVAELRAASEREKVALLLDDFENGSPDWLWETGPDGRLTHVSSRMAEVTGRSKNELGALTLVQLLDDLTVPCAIQGGNVVAAHLDRGEAFRDVVQPVWVGGEQRWWNLSGKPRADSEGWRGVGSDVTESTRQLDRIRSLATVDQLTGLPNRYALTERVADAVRARERFWLAILDLDDFKTVNDTLGHPTGDALLAAVGRRIRAWAADQTADGQIFCGRLGGDEFGLILSERGDALVAAQCEDLLADLQAPFLVAGARLEINGSVGAAHHPDAGGSAADLMRAADLALFAAKASGRGQLQLYAPPLSAAAQQRSMAVQQLGLALRRGELELYYQPQVRATDTQLLGFEALLRWRHPDQGIIAPATFITVAEETGLIVPIGEWVLRAACEQAAQWPGDLRIAVNLSAAQLRSGRIVEAVADALVRSGLPPHRLELEVTESVVVDERSVEVLLQLKALGAELSLDDFGTGYSSLASLSRLPVSRLKIDRSFITALDTGEEQARALVAAIVQLAKSLRLITVAEGVETARQQAAVQELECEVIQGYLHGRPEPAEAWTPWLDELRASAR